MHVKDLTAEQFARLSSLLDQAFETAPEQRPDWIADVGTRDPELSALVAELVASDYAANAEHLIETRDVLIRQFSAAVETQQSLIGKQFGHYRITRRLGYGGMGSVWLAERVDGLFARQVALKLLHASLMDAGMLERFARERTILAALDHPRIARLLDAGISDDGQPYLALEYVEGVALTDFCDQRRLDVAARVELFQQVLGAVQHAHASLVIHRDLKPSNIMVTADGDVRLLDFGIAKLIDEGETRQSELTQVGSRAFTPEYASPEQIGGLPVTAASDVYALGVVLYELLCGHRPYALKRATLGALEDAILTADPMNPSQMEASEADAAARSTTPKRLRQMLAGDLDTITLKALKKRPADRYGSANAMMQDLERFRRGEAVLARPDSASYRLGKFVRRNKLAVGAASATAMALAVGLAIAVWEAGAARNQAVIARSEAARATAVQDFVIGLFRANSVEQPDPVKARQTTARELLDLGNKRVDESLSSAPEARAAVLGTLSDMYYQLGMNAEAAANRAREVSTLKEAYGPADTRVAYALISYASDIADLPERTGVLAVLGEAKQILDSAQDDASEARGRLLMMLAQANRYTAIDKMLAYADQAVAFFQQRYPQSPGLSLALTYAASARLQRGDPEAAAGYYRQAVAKAGGKGGTASAAMVFPLTGLAEAQDALGDVDGAEQSYRAALVAAQANYGDYHPETLLVEGKLGAYLHATARRAEGDRWMATAMAGIGKGKGGYTPAFVVAVLSGLHGRMLLADGRIEDAAPLVAIDLTDARENFPGSVPLATALRSQIALDTARGRYDDAAREMDEALRIMTAIGVNGAVANRNRFLLDQSRLLLARGDAESATGALGKVTLASYAGKLPLNVQDVGAKTLLAEVHLQQGRLTAAVSAAQEASGQVDASPLRKYYPLLEAASALELGRAQRASGDPQMARPNLERAVQLRVSNGDVGTSPWLAEAQIALAGCLLELGQRQQARTLVRKAAAIVATHRELGEHLMKPYRELAAALSTH